MFWARCGSSNPAVQRAPDLTLANQLCCLVLVILGLFVAIKTANRKYDRDFLLSPEKRNQLVELWEVEKYGRDCFNDPNHVHLYGMPPKEWYARGVRIAPISAN